VIAGKDHWSLFFQHLTIINNDLPAKNFGS